jgi:hypothetical protein
MRRRDKEGRVNMHKTTVKQLLQEWARRVDAEGEREEVEGKLGIALKPGVPVEARCLDKKGNVSHSLDFHLERKLLPSGKLELTLTTPRAGEAAQVEELWLLGPDRETGGRVRVCIPVKGKVEGCRLTYTLSEEAVQKAPTDLLRARPLSVEARLAPFWQRLLEAVREGGRLVTGPVLQVEGLRPVGALAATAMDKPVAKGHRETDGIQVNWSQYSDGHVSLSFEGAGPEDEGRVVPFAVNAKTPDGEPLRRAFAVLVQSPLSPTPCALFEVASADLLDLGAEVSSTASEYVGTLADLPGIEWARQKAKGETLQQALLELENRISEVAQEVEVVGERADENTGD